ncbi:hypothetical protein O3M35_000500 [Rhynocoris fuscipes]|uniref:Uncharacterized protein n=1 Tax=Rhynocoris fuscipes TaxID=488301 RepID=A0AAW1DP45_9HEMI
MVISLIDNSKLNVAFDAAINDSSRARIRQSDNCRKSLLDVLRGSYLLARDSIVPRDVFLEGRSGFGHSFIFSNVQASEATSLVLASLACTSL